MTRSIERISAPDAPDPLGPYPHAVRVGGLLFCSGQGARDPATGEITGVTLDADGNVAGHDIAAQTDAALRNLARLLAGAGVEWERLVEITVFLKDMADYARMNEAYERHFPAGGPARTTVGASDLPGQNFIEVRAVAAAA